MLRNKISYSSPCAWAGVLTVAFCYGIIFHTLNLNLNRHEEHVLNGTREYLIALIRETIMRPIPRVLGKNLPQGQAMEMVKNLKGKRNGFFLEAGALDGVFWSNTLYLERVLNWTGVLVEPNVFNHAPLLQKSGRDRSVFVPTCLATTAEGSLLEYQMYAARRGSISYGGSFSGIRNHPNMEQTQQVEGRLIKTLPCLPLQAILDATGRKEIDLVSLDIQGPELDVLKTLDWSSPSRIKIKSFLLETKGVAPPRDNTKDIVDYLKTKEYVFVWQKALDVFMVLEAFKDEFQI